MEMFALHSSTLEKITILLNDARQQHMCVQDASGSRRENGLFLNLPTSSGVSRGQCWPRSRGDPTRDWHVAIYVNKLPLIFPVRMESVISKVINESLSSCHPRRGNINNNNNLESEDKFLETSPRLKSLRIRENLIECKSPKFE